jgi:hypothetical protein
VLATGVPLLTSVSPAHDEAWRQFTKREFVVLPRTRQRSICGAVRPKLWQGLIVAKNGALPESYRRFAARWLTTRPYE